MKVDFRIVLLLVVIDVVCKPLGLSTIVMPYLITAMAGWGIFTILTIIRS